MLLVTVTTFEGYLDEDNELRSCNPTEGKVRREREREREKKESNGRRKISSVTFVRGLLADSSVWLFVADSCLRLLLLNIQ